MPYSTYCCLQDGFRPFPQLPKLPPRVYTRPDGSDSRNPVDAPCHLYMRYPQLLLAKEDPIAASVLIFPDEGICGTDYYNDNAGDSG